MGNTDFSLKAVQILHSKRANWVLLYFANVLLYYCNEKQSAWRKIK